MSTEPGSPSTTSPNSARPTPSLPPGYRLEPLRIEDAAGLAVAYRRNADHLAPWDPVRPEVFFTAGFQALSVRKRLEKADGEVDSWVLRCQPEPGGAAESAAPDSAIIGRFNLNNVVRGALQSADLGYWVDAAHTGRGLATSCVELVVAAARDDLGLHRVAASTMINNVASQRVLERCGFTRYGLAEKFLCINGDWRDSLLFQRILHDQPLSVD